MADVTELRVNVLGPLECRLKNVLVPVPKGRRRRVLALLACHPGRPVAPEVLVEAGWGDELPTDPYGALYTVVSRLRSLLGPAVLRSTAAGYLFDIPAGAIDAGRFQVLWEEGARSRSDRARRLLDEALSLWRGPAFAEFADVPAIMTEARRLDALRLAALEERAALDLAFSEPERAVQRMEAVLAEEPFRDRAMHLLMSGLAGAGRPAEALVRFDRHCSLLAAELGLEPSPSLTELRDMLSGSRSVAARTVSTPTWLDTSNAFVGRDEVLAELASAVAESRLVTVTGAGGVGKSRTVAEALAALAPRAGVERIVVAELAEVPLGHVASAVAECLGRTEPSGLSIGDVAECVGTAPVLIVLDNCEHVLPDVTGLVSIILRRCPRARILATSRCRLGAPGERVIPLLPLSLTMQGHSGAPELSAPVRLFTDRMRRLRPTFSLHARNTPAVVAVCRLLDGLPLGLELAAGRAAALGVSTVLEQLRREADEAFASLHDVVDWSYRLLDEQQQRLLWLLSALPGDSDLATIRGVSSLTGGWLDMGRIEQSLAGLVEASLLSAYEAGQVTHFRMLALVRAYAARRLSESGTGDQVRRAHAGWVRAEGQVASEQVLNGLGAPPRLDRMQGHIAVALRNSLELGDLDGAATIAGCCQLFDAWFIGAELRDLVISVARTVEGSSEQIPSGTLARAAGACALALKGECERALAMALPVWPAARSPAEKVLCCSAMGVALLYTGRLEESEQWWRTLLSVDASMLHRADGEASLALVACYRGDFAHAREHAELAAVASETPSGRPMLAFAHYAAAEVALACRDERASALYEASAEEAGRTGFVRISQVARTNLVSSLVRRGEVSRARLLAGPLLEEIRRDGAWPQLWGAIRAMAELLLALGRPRHAALLLLAADQASSAPPPAGPQVPRLDALREALCDELGTTTYDAIGTLARDIPRVELFDRAVALARAIATGPSAAS